MSSMHRSLNGCFFLVNVLIVSKVNGALACSSGDPFAPATANRSAFSFSGILQWAGTHSALIMRPLSRCRRIVDQSRIT